MGKRLLIIRFTMDQFVQNVGENQMKQYKWKQPKSTLMVESDPLSGYIRVFKNKKVIFNREHLTPGTVALIESHFLDKVTHRDDTPEYIR